MNGTSGTSRWHSYWFEYQVSMIKLRLFRVVFFSVLAVDAWRQVEHAPRYGAGAFNVAHFPVLDTLLPLPTRSGLLVVWLLLAFCALRAAFGIAVTTSIVLCTGLFGYAYFISQLDSYQHHYLVFLLLMLCCCIPWKEARDSGAPGVRSWAARLMLVQMSLLYAWAAVAKTDPLWLDGSALAAQLSADWVRAAIAGSIGYAAAAQAVLVLETVLAACLLVSALQPLALLIGPAMHVVFELGGLKIGLFSYLALAVYLLVVPDRWVASLAARVRGRLGGTMVGRSFLEAKWTSSVGAALVVVASSSALLLLPFPEAVVVAGIVAVLGLTSIRSAAGRDGAAGPVLGHVAACAIVVVLALTTDQVHSYYKFWGGTARRLGDRRGETVAYATLVTVSPWYGAGHYHHGRLLAEAGRPSAALASFRRARELAPADWRASVGEAVIHHEAGRGDDALRAARRVLALQPAHEVARRIEATWLSRE